MMIKHNLLLFDLVFGAEHDTRFFHRLTTHVKLNHIFWAPLDKSLTFSFIFVPTSTA